MATNLEKLGYKIGPDGSLVALAETASELAGSQDSPNPPAPGAGAEAPAEQPPAKPAVTTPVPVPQDEPAPDPASKRGAQGEDHDWDKRREAAQAEQRKLSRLQMELRAEKEALQRDREAMENDRKALQTQLVELEEKVKAPRKAELEGFLRDYPQMAEAVKALIEQEIGQAKPVREIENLRQDLQAQQQATAKTAYELRLEKVISQVVQEVPDAVALANEPGMYDFVQAQPPELQKIYQDAVYDNTGNTDPRLVAKIMREYAATKAPAAPAATTPKPPKAPALGPDNAGESTVPGAPMERAQIRSLTAQVIAAGTDHKKRQAIFDRLAQSLNH